MNIKIAIILLFLSQLSLSQVTYTTPEDGVLPEKIEHLKVGIEVIHFPKENDPIKIKDKYYWKHATAILSKNSDVTITEFGAYLYYNDQWNLRKSYDLKDLDKNFGTHKQVLKQGEPYVWAKNWRVDKTLFGGWALWYFIGINEDGHTVCGYATIHTTSNLLNQ